ncbi:MAG: GerMN domain-containing protein [Leptospirales bacterium]|nr:GerMN domain-containing protein [Leptospirales bacterium]
MEKKVKKSTAKKSAPKKAVKKQTPQKSGGNGPFYVIVIIILITIIILLINKFYDWGKFQSYFAKLHIENIISSKEPAKEPVDPLKNVQTDSKSQVSSPADNKNVDNTTSKVEDKNIDDRNDKKAKDDIPTDREISLYFLQFDEKTEKVNLKTVKRKLSDKQILSQTLNQLIKGPSPYEEGKGYITAVPSNLKVRSVTINGKTAEIDFNKAIEEGATGDILLKRIQQIVYTATQFEDVDSIIIKIDGQRRKSIGGDGFSISGPLKR